jgi:hypothetical protein
MTAIQSFSSVEKFIDILGKIRNIKTTDEAKMPFGIYNTALARTLRDINISVESSAVVSGGVAYNYKITTRRGNLIFEFENEDMAFYALLIEYIGSNMHIIKPSRDD